MAKIYGINGYATGKQGNTVFVIRNGVQISRQYNPNPENPKSTSQVEARAKLKLISQLAAAMAPAIAIPKEGIVSSRNIFSKENYRNITYAQDKAQVQLLNVHLTRSTVGLPPVVVSSREGTTINVNLSAALALAASRVVYAMFVIQSDETLRYAGSTVATAAGVGNNWAATLTLPSATAPVVVYAYAVRDNTEAARVAFGNMSVPTADSIAQLIVTKVLTESDVTLTETRAVVSNPSQSMSAMSNHEQSMRVKKS